MGKFKFEIKRVYIFNTILHPILFFAPTDLAFMPDTIRRTENKFMLFGYERPCRAELPSLSFLFVFFFYN